MHTKIHTQYSLCFLLWSDCGRVLCWSNSQTTVAALFVPSLLCDRHEGSPLCDHKPFLSSLSHSEPVWAWEPAYRKKKNCHFYPHLLFNVLCLSDKSGAGLMLFCVLLLFPLLSLISSVFFLQIDNAVKKKKRKKKEMIISSLLEKAFYLSCMLKCR